MAAQGAASKKAAKLFAAEGAIWQLRTCDAYEKLKANLIWLLLRGKGQPSLPSQYMDYCLP